MSKTVPQHSAELSARITAATAALADFTRETDAYLDRGAERPDFDGWAWRLQIELQMLLGSLAGEPAAGPNLVLAGPSAADVRAAFPEWEICQSLDGDWSARLTTTPQDGPEVRLTGRTLAGLVHALNNYAGGNER